MAAESPERQRGLAAYSPALALARGHALNILINLNGSLTLICKSWGGKNILPLPLLMKERSLCNKLIK